MTVITSGPSCLVIDKDTIKNLSVINSFTFDRDKKPIIVTAFNDSVTKTVSIKSINSFAYWLNLYPNLHFWTGFYIDTKTKKRYTYPKTVYVDLATPDNSYLTYKPLDKPYDKYSNILKITPLKIVGLDFPSIELSFERRTGSSFSTQVLASYLLPNGLMNNGNDFNPNIKGFRLSIEEKYYFKKSAPLGPYVSFEFNYLNNKYKDIWNFGIKNIYSDTTYNFTNYTDTFGIKKQTYSFNLKLGYQYIVKRLSFDFYAGIGLRYKDVRHFDRINPNDEMEMPRHPNFYYITNHEGKYWTVSIPLNVKIGWTF
ncbi:MAG: DUF3575 domain-containing protein [Bacteroidales bacterium]|nr:DUF3575 domain-containing protein [Bacteroidales bacterium]